MKYHFRLHKDGKGFWAECVELRGCATQGNTRQQLMRNLREALHVFLEEPESSRVIHPLPRALRPSKNLVEVPVDPPVAFAFLLRRERLQRGITQKEVAGRLQLSLYGYQRLESSKTANPRLSTLLRLQEIFPKLMPLRLVA